ncbi:MAG: ParA family protein [Chitinivibrionales bacterium]|nr:ParA family protein [Chitinivibrionales bacterium]
MKIFSVLNYKGGVGKTTFSISISQALAIAGFRVLTIDNDSQHNLSFLLGRTLYRPNIRDVYLSSILTDAGRFLMHSIRETGVKNLHIISSQKEMSSADIHDPSILQQAIAFCGLNRFYDFIFIDNAAGMDRLQEVSIRAADEILVPTELSHFAMSGIDEMHQILAKKFNNACQISKIIPNFVRSSNRHKVYLEELRQAYPEKVTNTVIPFDSVFDECIREGKILFYHRLYTKASAQYLKLVNEIFNLDENRTWETALEKRKTKMRAEAKKRFVEQSAKRKGVPNEVQQYQRKSSAATVPVAPTAAVESSEPIELENL